MLMFGVDLLLAALTLAAISAMFYHLGSSRNMPVFIFYQITVYALIMAFAGCPFSRWIFPRWFSASKSAKKRVRLKDWRYWNKSTISPTLQNEAWFQKPE